jgi:energy-coupling factor transporter ATP-binding protein EcfA2
MGIDYFADVPDEDPANSKPFDIDSIPSVLSLKTGGIEYVVDQMIPARTMSILVGPNGAGKSTIASAIAGCVSLGLPFAGRKTMQMRVLFLDRENSDDIVQDRFHRLGIRDDSNIKHWGGWCPEEPYNPGSAAILAWVEKTEPKPLIIIDTFSSFLEGDENSSEDVKLFLHPIKKLTDLGATALLLHFPPKGDDEGCRGSSEILTPFSTRYNLFTKKETVIDNLRLIRKKQRVKSDEEILLRYETGIGFLADDKAFSEIRTATEQLRDLLREHPNCTRTRLVKLASPLGLRNNVDSFLDTGLTYGEIECDGNPKHGGRFRLKTHSNYADSWTN